MNVGSLISWTAISLIIHTAILGLPRWPGNNPRLAEQTVPVAIVYAAPSDLPLQRQPSPSAVITPSDPPPKPPVSRHKPSLKLQQPTTTAAQVSTPSQANKNQTPPLHVTEPPRITCNFAPTPVPPAEFSKTPADTLPAPGAETVTTSGDKPASAPTISSAASTMVAAAAPIVAAPVEKTIHPPRFEKNPAPDYPPVALKRRWQGDVLLRALIGAQGEVLDVRIKNSSGHAVLDNCALDTVRRRWKFYPAQDGETKIRQEVLCPICFKLPQI